MLQPKSFGWLLKNCDSTEKIVVFNKHIAYVFKDYLYDSFDSGKQGRARPAGYYIKNKNKEV